LNIDWKSIWKAIWEAAIKYACESKICHWSKNYFWIENEWTYVSWLRLNLLGIVNEIRVNWWEYCIWNIKYGTITQTISQFK
jgi:hypothetical protein